MAKRSSKLDADDSDDDIIILDEHVSKRTRNEQPPLVITLDEDDDLDLKTKQEPEVECLEDVIILDNEDADIVCLDELKPEVPTLSKSSEKKVECIEDVVSPEPGKKDSSSQEKSAADGGEVSRVLTRSQRALLSANQGRETPPDSPNASPTRQGILTRRQKALGRKPASSENSPTRVTRQRTNRSNERVEAVPETRQEEEKDADADGQVKSVGVDDQVNSMVVDDQMKNAGDNGQAKDMDVDSQVKNAGSESQVKSGATDIRVKSESEKPKAETELSAATFWGSLTVGLMRPKVEATTSSRDSAVVVKTQPPEQCRMEVETASTTVPPTEKEEDDDEEVEPGPDHFRRVFVARLNRQTTKETLKRYFGQWGKIVDVCLPVDYSTKRSRGFAFVTFTKARMVDAVQNARPHTIDGETVDCKRAVPRWEAHMPQARIKVRKAFVHGLRGLLTEKDLEEYFNTFGKVIGCRIVKQRGFGFVEFDDYDPVDKLFLHKAHRIKGRPVGTDKAIGRAQLASFQNWWRHFPGRHRFGTQSWGGMNPRGNQYSRRIGAYWQHHSTFGNNNYQSRFGGGPVRNYYTRRYTPYYSPSAWRTSTYTQPQDANRTSNNLFSLPVSRTSNNNPFSLPVTRTSNNVFALPSARTSNSNMGTLPASGTLNNTFALSFTRTSNSSFTLPVTRTLTNMRTLPVARTSNNTFALPVARTSSNLFSLPSARTSNNSMRTLPTAGTSSSMFALPVPRTSNNVRTLTTAGTSSNLFTLPVSRTSVTYNYSTVR